MRLGTSGTGGFSAGVGEGMGPDRQRPCAPAILGLFERRFLTVSTGPVPLAVWHWGTGQRPPLLLLHGTGLAAACLFAVAGRLARHWDVYAVDRRGHGASGDPDWAVGFADFAEDVAHVLALRPHERWYGVGHSAGATDLLLAAGVHPDRFAGLVCHEPTSSDPPGALGEERALDHADDPGLWFTMTERRKAHFPDRSTARARYEGRGIFADWDPDVLDAFIEHGFRDSPQGVSLCCLPAREMLILHPIVATMHNTAEAARWFAPLAQVRCPVLLTDSSRSLGLFTAMNDRVQRWIPQALRYRFDGGHCLPMERPGDFAALAARALEGRL